MQALVGAGVGALLAAQIAVLPSARKLSVRTIRSGSSLCCSLKIPCPVNDPLTMPHGSGATASLPLMCLLRVQLHWTSPTPSREALRRHASPLRCLLPGVSVQASLDFSIIPSSKRHHVYTYSWVLLSCCLPDTQLQRAELPAQ